MVRDVEEVSKSLVEMVKPKFTVEVVVLIVVDEVASGDGPTSIVVEVVVVGHWTSGDGQKTFTVTAWVIPWAMPSIASKMEINCSQDKSGTKPVEDELVDSAWL